MHSFPTAVPLLVCSSPSVIMRLLDISSAALLLIRSVAASNNVVVESLAKVPSGWKKVRDADPNQFIKLRIALQQPGLAAFEQKLYDISTPQHALYGRHLSREELKDMMKPRDESTTAVLGWLEAAGIPSSSIENTGEWINVRTTAANAEELLNTTYSIYNHVGTRVERLRTLR